MIATNGLEARAVSQTAPIRRIAHRPRCCLRAQVAQGALKGRKMTWVSRGHRNHRWDHRDSLPLISKCLIIPPKSSIHPYTVKMCIVCRRRVSILSAAPMLFGGNLNLPHLVLHAFPLHLRYCHLWLFRMINQYLQALFLSCIPHHKLRLRSTSSSEGAKFLPHQRRTLLRKIRR